MEADDSNEPNEWRFQHDLLCEVALRFDGYRFAESTRCDAIELGRAMVAGTLMGTDDEAMCVLFHLQRYVCKWGGEQEPLDGEVWRTIRALVIRLALLPVPDFWRMQPPAWPERSPDELVTAIERLRTIDAAMRSNGTLHLHENGAKQ